MNNGVSLVNQDFSIGAHGGVGPVSLAESLPSGPSKPKINLPYMSKAGQVCVGSRRLHERLRDCSPTPPGNFPTLPPEVRMQCAAAVQVFANCGRLAWVKCLSADLLETIRSGKPDHALARTEASQSKFGLAILQAGSAAVSQAAEQSMAAQMNKVVVLVPLWLSGAVCLNSQQRDQGWRHLHLDIKPADANGPVCVSHAGFNKDAFVVASSDRPVRKFAIEDLKLGTAGNQAATFVIFSPVIGTGNTMVAAIEAVKSLFPREFVGITDRHAKAKHTIVVASLFASAEGLVRVLNPHPDVHAFIASADYHLNEYGVCCAKPDETNGKTSQLGANLAPLGCHIKDELCDMVEINRWVAAGILPEEFFDAHIKRVLNDHLRLRHASTERAV